MKNESVLLSVIVPAYNVKDYIQDCIDSIFRTRQSEREISGRTDRVIELILVDDGSTDGTGEICDQNAENDSRIRVIHQQNNGVGSARNTGIRNARGEWICFVDSDDWVNIHVLEEILENPRIDGCDMVCFSLEMERPNGHLKISSDTKLWYEYDLDPNNIKNRNNELFQRLCLQNQMYWPDVIPNSEKYPIMTICVNKLIKRKFLVQNNIFMPENIAQHEDGIFNYRCIKFARKISFYDSVAYHYRYRPTSAVHSDGIKMIRQMKDTIHCFHETIGENNFKMLEDSFAYSTTQMIWTIIDRLGKSSATTRDLPVRAAQLKELISDPLIGNVFNKIEISKVYRLKHKVVCAFLKCNMILQPIWMCYVYHKMQKER